MDALDYLVLLGTLLGIAAYGVWKTRGRTTASTYLKGRGDTPWLAIGLSVMATQASAVTFLSTPGQGYESGMGFVQNYFGTPIALMLVAAIFVPLYRRLNISTAYEYLGQRFDDKTRLLGAIFFLFQRGLGAGITIYAPAIVLSTVFGWRLDLTILCSGLLVIAYTVAGGSEAVTETQKYQLGVIFVGMAAAFVILLRRLPAGLSVHQAWNVAGAMGKLNALDFSTSLKPRYTVWSGTIGGLFLALAYFGADQSQVQRYIGGANIRQSRLGLMFNAVLKVPMQYLILLLGAMLYVFYVFNAPPVFFNEPAWQAGLARDSHRRLVRLQQQFDAANDRKRQLVGDWLAAEKAGDMGRAATAETAAQSANRRSQALREQAKAELNWIDPGVKANDADYVFIDFILKELPHGLIGLLVASFFAAALASKAAELNALASTTMVDVYQHMIRRDAGDRHYLVASKCFVVMWGMIAIGFALFANLVENLIQASNIIGSIFYGAILGLFVIGFFLKWVGGPAAFMAAIAAQALVLALYFKLDISYLWYNLIGCVLCAGLGVLLQPLLGRKT